MKVINKEDLLLLLSNCKEDTFDEDDLKSLLNRYGDDWFVQDGEFRCTHKSKRMQNLRCKEKV